MRKPLFYLLCAAAMIFITCKPKVAETRLDGLRFYTDRSIVVKELTQRESLNPAEHFFLADSYNSQKEYKKAMHHYTQSVFMESSEKDITLYADPIYKYISKRRFHSSYYDPAVYHIADLFYTYKEYDYVLKFAEQISADDPALYFRVIRLVMDAYIKLDQHESAVTYCDEKILLIQNEDLRQTLYIRKASAQEKAQKFEDAYKTYLAIIKADSDRWQAHTAAAQIYRLHTEHAVPLSEGDRADIAGGLISAKKLDEAAEVINAMKGEGRNETSVRFRYFLAQNQTSDAARLLQVSKKDEELYKSLLKIQGDYYYWKKQYLAVRSYRELLTYEGDYQREFARVCYYLYHRSRADASSFMLTYIDRYPETPQAQEFLWLYARTYILRGNIKKVLPVLESITSRPENSYYGNAAYWLYRYYDDAGKKKESREMFFKMVVHAPDSWYTWIEADRVKGDYDLQKLQSSFDASLSSADQSMALFTHFMLYLTDGNEERKEERIEKLKAHSLYPYMEFDTFVSSPLESIYVDLFKTYYEAGYMDGIQDLLQYLEDSSENRKLKYYVMSNFGGMYGNYYYAYLGSARLFREFDIKENIALFSNEYARRLFPLAFQDIVEKTAKRYPGVEPLQIYSVMKAESAFNHSAVSHAGATGLMQVMPGTGRDIARGLKMNDYDLKNPEHSILFGFSYLNWLSSLYGGKFDQMLGGYNAGPGNMNKWRRSFDTRDAILFAENIPFYETRHYVFKNQKFLIQYKTIYER